MPRSPRSNGTNMRALFIAVSTPEREPWAQELAAVSGCPTPVIVVATPAQAAHFIAERQLSPSHVVFDIGHQGEEVLTEIDQLAQQCEPGTRVIAVGDTNDIHLFRSILARGVLDYRPMPAPVNDIIKALTAPSAAPQATALAKASSGTNKRVIVFMTAASGDGASTLAINTAFAISQLSAGSTVLVDMDYQYGLVAKNLALQNQYGIRELFDHPERGVDTTLIKRMVSQYGPLHVISAPSELRYLPMVNAVAINELITTLRETYDNVIIDLPHVWLPWVANVLQQSTHIVLVAQLWLRSVSHASRLMRAFREAGISADKVTAVINRSGSKFNETIESRDFERVCGIPIRHTLANDIKTIVAAEAMGKTVLEQAPSQLANDIRKLAHMLTGQTVAETEDAKRGGLFPWRKG